MNEKILILLLILVLPMAMGHIPGTFFWKPRLAIDLSIPTTKPPFGVARAPKKEHIYAGMIVLVDGYAAGVTVIALAAGLSSSASYPHLNPISGFYFTNVYRWGLRYMALIPHWASGHGGNFADTHKVWRRRFYYMDEFMPKWMRAILPFVQKKEWDKEYQDWKRFKKYSEAAFGRHYRYPNKQFNNFKSMETKETAEINYQEVSSESQQK